MLGGSRDGLAKLVAAVVPTLVGCGAAEIDTSQFSRDACGNGVLAVASMIEPAEPVDYLQLRVGTPVYYGEDDTVWESDVIDDSGKLCGGATDYDACAAAFGEAERESEIVWSSGMSGVDYLGLAFTRGDTVGTIGTLDSLQAFLGPVDAPGDAALLVRTQGYELACSAEHQVGTHGEGFVVYAQQRSGCGIDDVDEHVVLVRTDGSLEVLQSVLAESPEVNCTAGRLPPGLCVDRRLSAPQANPVGEYFADLARLEAASVPAFAQLARELAAHGAPAPLVSAALRSRRDEVLHAGVMSRLARRYGGNPTPPRVRATPTRPLVEMAAENAAEGCVRETFGALVAHAQARRARDPHVRNAMARIARDETRHAALSWEVARWARTHLSPAARRHVDLAAQRAAECLRVALTRPSAEAVHDLAGLPRPAAARRAFDRMTTELLA